MPPTGQAICHPSDRPASTSSWRGLRPGRRPWAIWASRRACKRASVDASADLASLMPVCGGSADPVGRALYAVDHVVTSKGFLTRRQPISPGAEVEAKTVTRRR
jgi:hypothetical protein